MFKIGDKVKFKKSSIDTGMIDATENDVFEVVSVHKEHWGTLVSLDNISGGINISHLEHVKESAMTNTDDAMNNTEEQEIKWEVGQEVFCCVFGKGTVIEISKNGPYPLRVSFEHEENTDEGYTMDGKLFTAAENRTLFFSEPKIIAEKFPPKKPFVPTLKEGDIILAKDYRGFLIIRVSSEDEHFVYNEDGTGFGKGGWEFRTLGEEIIFN